MTKDKLINSIRQTFTDCITLVEKKNQDYARGNDAFANFRSSEVAGVSPERAILIRVLDKISRVSNLLEKEPAVTDEKLTDTLIDCINYLAILKAFKGI